MEDKVIGINEKPVETDWERFKKEVDIPIKKSAIKKRFAWWYLAVAFVVVLGICLGINIYGIYNYNWQGVVSQQVAKVFRLPAGSVNGQKILLADYWQDLTLLKTALEQDREGSGTDLLTEEQFDIEKQIFNRLIMIKLMEQELDRYGQKVNQAELDDKMETLLSQFEDTKSAQQSIQDLYGLNIEQFKNKVLYPLLIQDKLQELIAKDTSLEINQAAQKEAQDILNIVMENPGDFAAIASQFTQDESGVYTGGDLGWINQGELSPDMEEIVFMLPEKTVYDKIVQNRLGYHIVKVSDKLTDEETGKQSAKVAHILIRVDLGEYLLDLYDQAVIKENIEI